jgi:Ni/Co efflux regulator RcnB
MRKILITLLLASAAASPALAGPHNSADRQQAREDRVQARDDARADRSADRPSYSAPARPSYAPPAQPSYTPPARSEQFQAAPRQQAVERPQFVRPERRQPQFNVDAVRAQRDALAAQRNQRVEQVQQRVQDMRDNRDLRQANRPTPVMRDRNPPVVSDTPRPGTQPPLRADGGQRLQEMHWNRNWQNDSRYDWRRYRNRHRSLFHLGFYYDPFGWGYQSFGIGYRMWPAYYGNQFWIDPAMYGLPYPPPGAAWIRYYNDAILIDTFTGTIIDEIPDFFW